MRLIEGANGLAVAELKRSHLDALVEAAWREQRAKLLETLDEACLTPQEKLVDLKEHDLHRGSSTPLRLWLISRTGCRQIIEAACKIAKVDFFQFLGDLHDPSLQRIARELVAMIDEPREEAEAGEPSAGAASLGQAA